MEEPMLLTPEWILLTVEWPLLVPIWLLLSLELHRPKEPATECLPRSPCNLRELKADGGTFSWGAMVMLLSWDGDYYFLLLVLCLGLEALFLLLIY